MLDRAFECFWWFFCLSCKRTGLNDKSLQTRSQRYSQGGGWITNLWLVNRKQTLPSPTSSLQLKIGLPKRKVWSPNSQPSFFRVMFVLWSHHLRLVLFFTMILKDLPQKGNVITYSAAISACEKGSQWLKPNLHHPKNRHRKPKVEIPVPLNAKRVWSLEGVTKKTIETLAAGNLWNFRNLLKPGRRFLNRSFQSQPRWQYVFSLLAKMKNRQLQGNIITYSAAISACGRGQEWQHALRLLTQLWDWHLEANVITYNAGITACEKGSQWHIALKLMEELQEN